MRDPCLHTQRGNLAMTYAYRRTYRGPIQAVIFDWAGTTMDFGCVAPAVVFIEVFKREGVPIDMAEARGPMGAAKRAHIAQIAAMPSVRERWFKVHGSTPTEADVDRMYAAFIPLQLDCLSQYSDLIPGALETVNTLKGRGIKIGSSSGYNTEMMAVNIRDTARRGFTVDLTVCASDVPHGRPNPDMCLLNVMKLGITTVEACVKVDDTLTGIEEGLNAGMWSIGVAISGNEVGLSHAEWLALQAPDQARARARAYARMQQCGAHYVVDSIADLMPCIDDITARLARGERP